MKRIGITIGDPSGIGPEISLKALSENKAYRDKCIIFGSKSILEFYRNKLKISLPFNYVTNVINCKSDAINVFNVIDTSLDQIGIGKINPVSGDLAYKYLEKSISLALANKIGPIVTAPLNKEALHLGGHNFDGHTEIFATLTNTKKYAMMLWSKKLSVVHVSTHVALRQACNLVKKERVMDCISLADTAMRRLGIKTPRIAVAGLNPHSGENGLFGSEEQEEIIPAIQAMNQRNYTVGGPISPDTVFLRAVKGEFDVVIAMYHDQGHIPMKLLAFDEGVNVTLGLPIIRTSVDHGTAFDIAGKGIAKSTSMLQSIKLAARFAESTTDRN